MRRTLYSFLILTGLAGMASAESVLIEHAVLVSGQSPLPVRDAWVLFADGQISAVGSGSNDVVADTVIDAAGRYLVPGLIDSHVHLYHATGLKRKYSDNFDELYREYMQQQPRSYLYYGFTTVVELNADLASNELFESAPIHPRLFHCGQGVILDDGFMALDIPPGKLAETNPGYLVDHYRRGVPPQDADHTPEAAVNHVLSNGGRCIKLYYEEALWWPGTVPRFALPTVEIIRDLVAAAHGHRLPVILHATTPAGHSIALDSGVDILAHGMWEWTGQQFDVPEPNADNRRIAAEVSASELRVQPTLTTIRNTASLFDPAVLNDPGWAHAVSGDYLQYLRTDSQAQREDFIEMFGSSFPEGTTAEDLPLLQQGFQRRYRKLITAMIDDGANMIFATDTAVGGFGWAAPPGLAGYREIVSWAEAGVPLDVLFTSLTVNNAIALGVDDVVGTIEPGKRADMLLLEKDPLVFVDAYDSIALLVVDGEVVKRGVLSATH